MTHRADGARAGRGPVVPAAGRGRRRVRFAQALGVAGLLLGAWGAAGEPLPARVVSLAPSLTEIVFALGAGDRLVGVSTSCDHPPDARRLPRMGSFVTPNVEAILAARPDLVLAVPSPGNRHPVVQLERLGIRVLVVAPETVDETRAAIRAVGAALGREEAAAALVGRIDAGLAAVEARLAGRPARRVLLVVGHTPLIAAGAGTLQDELIARARGENVARVAGSRWPHLSLEAAIAAAPEVIVDTSMGSEARGQDAVREFWRACPTIPAVRQGAVHAPAGDALLRGGPRLVEALELLARLVHPEAFAGAPAAARPAGGAAGEP